MRNTLLSYSSIEQREQSTLLTTDQDEDEDPVSVQAGIRSAERKDLTTPRPAEN